jgi:hypothetical protein
LLVARIHVAKDNEHEEAIDISNEEVDNGVDSSE